MSSASIRKIPEDERPRERCLTHGGSTLSLRECLAVLLGSGPAGLGCLGVADKILRSHESRPEPLEQDLLFSALENPLASPVLRSPGLGPAGRARLIATSELMRRYWVWKSDHQARSRSHQRATGPRAASALVPLSSRSAVREWLGFVPIAPSGKAGPFCVVEQGVRTHVNFAPADLFEQVLTLKARGFYLFHNHPSGNPQASPEDVHLTHQVDQIARALGIQLLGHGIVTPDGDVTWIEFEGDPTP